MQTATRLLLLAAIVSVVSSSAAKAFDPLGLCCQSRCCSSACDQAPCGGCDYVEPGCGCNSECCDCYTEPGCGCGAAAGCGCDVGPACGCDVAPDFGCDYSACDAMGYGSCCKPTRYCTMFGGYNLLQDYEGQIASHELRGTFEDGWLFGVAAGRRVHDSMRAELEFTLRTNTGDQGSIAGAGSYLSGHAYSWTAMTNLVYDYHNCKLHGITPYAGVGIGIAVLDGHFATSVANLNIEDAAFAFQTMLGASTPLTNSTEFFSEYRYMGTTNVAVNSVGIVPPLESSGENLNNHAAVFGIRFFR